MSDTPESGISRLHSAGINQTEELDIYVAASITGHRLFITFEQWRKRKGSRPWENAISLEGYGMINLALDRFRPSLSRSGKCPTKAALQKLNNASHGRSLSAGRKNRPRQSIPGIPEAVYRPSSRITMETCEHSPKALRTKHLLST